MLTWRGGVRGLRGLVLKEFGKRGQEKHQRVGRTRSPVNHEQTDSYFSGTYLWLLLSSPLCDGQLSMPRKIGEAQSSKIYPSS